MSAGTKILVAGDSYVSVADFKRAFSEIEQSRSVRYVEMKEGVQFVPSTASELKVREFLGSPSQLVSELSDEECLVVHGAPVTDIVLDASPSLKLVCCARGGPVNVDIAAATARKIPVVTAPGKNADAVADLAIAMMIMLSRNLVRALDHVKKAKVVGADNYEGNQFFGRELGGKTLGLVGYGRVGSKVSKRALAFGVSVLVYDPFLDKSKIEEPGVRVTDLKELLSKSDFVSIHARESKENENLISKKEFALMKPGSYFINTARPSLVDEIALLEALDNKTIFGAALDVVRYDPNGPTNPLLEKENVILTPHIGGATFETTTKGAQIVANQLQRYYSGLPLETVINPAALQS
ncbi:MAG: NAD(P)-dependent oxidoreductase [Nitrososphaerales archaeon]